jgi:small subunit ribosomal protein S16
VAVKIRLLRVGKAKQPSYRVVVADSRSPRDGRIIETIGHYGPRAEPSRVEINAERALSWLRQGAQPTEQVQKLLTTIGVWSTFESEKGHRIVTKLNRRGFATGKVPTPTKAAPAATETPAPKATPAPQPAAAPEDTPTASDVPAASDAGSAAEPEAPTAVEPEAPTAVEPEAPTAIEPEAPTAVEPEAPTAAKPEAPSEREEPGP